MKRKDDRLYEDNPGFKCKTQVAVKSLEDIEVQFYFVNESIGILCLWDKKLPFAYLWDECLIIEDLDEDKNLDYNGNSLDRDVKFNPTEVIVMRPNNELVLKCNVTKYFTFEIGKNYRLKYNTWMPLIDAEKKHTMKYYKKDNRELPIFFLLETEWVNFKT